MIVAGPRDCPLGIFRASDDCGDSSTRSHARKARWSSSRIPWRWQTCGKTTARIVLQTSVLSVPRDQADQEREHLAGDARNTRQRGLGLHGTPGTWESTNLSWRRLRMQKERDTQSAWTTSAPGTTENTLVDSATRRTVTMQRVRRIQMSSTSTSGTGQHGFDWVHPVIGSLMVDEKSSRLWWWSFRQRQMGDHARGDDRRSRNHYGRRLLIRLELLSNSRSNIIWDWAAAHCIQWDLSPVGTQQRTGQATISLVKTAATKMASCDAAFSIPELFTWASAVHNEIFTHANPRCHHPLPCLPFHRGTVSWKCGPVRLKVPRKSAACEGGHSGAYAHLAKNWAHQQFECGDVVWIWREIGETFDQAQHSLSW